MSVIHMVDDWDCTHTLFHTEGRYHKLTRKDMVAADILREKVIACYYGPHFYSICTHGGNRDMIFEVLLDVCNLSREEADSVAIINLSHTECSDKSIHINRSLDWHKIKPIKSKGPLYSRYPVLTVITDDSPSNMDFPIKEGAVGISVNSDLETLKPLDDKHLHTGLAILKQPKMVWDIAIAHAESRGKAGTLHLPEGPYRS